MSIAATSLHVPETGLANKLERLRRARVSNLVLCIDAERNVGDGDVPSNAAVVPRNPNGSLRRAALNHADSARSTRLDKVSSRGHTIP